MWGLTRYKPNLIGFGLSVCLMASVVKAEPSMTFQMDNDIVYGTDRDYTGGFKFKTTDDRFNLRLLKSLDAVISARNWQVENDQLELSVEAFSLVAAEEGQLNTLLNEAWTHIDLRRFYSRHIEQRKQRLNLELSLGWLGSKSPGQSLQNRIHYWIGNDPADEAQYELSNQPTLQLGVDYSEDWFKLKHWQFYRSAWLKVGSPFTQGYLGVGFVRTFNSQPVFQYNQLNHVKSVSKKRGYFYFASAGMSYLLHSALLDDGLYTNDAALVDRNLWIPLAKYGAGLTYEQLAVSLSGNVVGNTYKAQPTERFRFASLSVTWFF